MNKTDALAHFGDPSTDQGRAAAVSAMADYFGISRAAIYMWPDDKPIPKLRALQIEMRVAELARVAPVQQAGGVSP